MCWSVKLRSHAAKKMSFSLQSPILCIPCVRVIRSESPSQIPSDFPFTAPPAVMSQQPSANDNSNFTMDIVASGGPSFQLSTSSFLARFASLWMLLILFPFFEYYDAGTPSTNLGESTANDVSTYMSQTCPWILYFNNFGPRAQRNLPFFIPFIFTSHMTCWRPATGRLLTMSLKQWSRRRALGKCTVPTGN
jgi:hypothetical protein